MLIKLEGDKKVSDVLNLLHKKQDEIDVYLQEKRFVQIKKTENSLYRFSLTTFY